MAAKDHLVAIDDGHGIDTAGKRTPPIPELGGIRIKENQFNEAVAMIFDDELKRCGFRTLQVAPEKNDVPLTTRVKRANDAKADIYVSFHFNAFDSRFGTPGGDPSGQEIFHSPGSVNGKRLANDIYNEMIKGTPQKKRGVKTANFHVLRETKMPAVLSESGFMDNKTEALLMLNKNYQKEVAQEHAKGVCNYFGVKYVPETVKPTPKPPTSSSKPDNSNDLLVRINTQSLNVRQSPNNTSKINTSVKRDQVYTIVEVRDGWGRLKSGVGWIHLGYTQPVRVVPKPTPTPPAKNMLVRVNVAVLNVRAKPNTSAKVTAKVYKNQVYTIIETSGKWGRLKSGLGWIHLDYTKKV